MAKRRHAQAHQRKGLGPRLCGYRVETLPQRCGEGFAEDRCMLSTLYLRCLLVSTVFATMSSLHPTKDFMIFNIPLCIASGIF